MAGEKLADFIMQRHGNQTEYADIVFGTVTQINPLKIQVGDKLVIPEELLILSQNVGKKKVDISGENLKLSGGNLSVSTISGSVSASGLTVSGKEIIIDQTLKVNDKVVMFRMDGGQTFFVMEKTE